MPSRYGGYSPLADELISPHILIPKDGAAWP